MSASSPSQTVFSIGYDFHVGNGVSGTDNGNVWNIYNYRDRTRDQSFNYDALNRLTSAQNAGANCAATTVNGKTEYWGNSYGYDAWGNLTAKTVTKCSAENLSVTALVNNQLSGYGYDAAGNMTSDPTDGVTASYDAENRIASATRGGVTTSYVYDADGNRVEKITPPPPATPATGTLYWYMTPGIVAESDLAGNLKSEYVFFNGERMARRDYPAGSVAYYFSDHLKTASVITDAAGNIKSESDYYPWGGELQFVANDSNHYKFTGKERDTESGLDYFGARYYSNGLGRFITPDWAAKATTVPYAEFSDPQSLNLYSYVRNIPTVRVDADGHCCDNLFDSNPFYVAWHSDSSANHAQSKTDFAIGAGKELVNMVTSTVNIGLNMAVHNGTYVPGTTPEIPQLEMSNPMQVAGAVATAVVTTVAPLVPEETMGSTVVATSKISAPESAVSKVDSIINTIDEGGFNVTANAKTATQEANITITHPEEPGVKLNLRTETHPLEPGGQPARHVNVERVEPGPKSRPEVKSNRHIDQ